MPHVRNRSTGVLLLDRPLFHSDGAGLAASVGVGLDDMPSRVGWARAAMSVTESRSWSSGLSSVESACAVLPRETSAPQRHHRGGDLQQRGRSRAKPGPSFGRRAAPPKGRSMRCFKNEGWIRKAESQDQLVDVTLTRWRNRIS